jgi:hypothetical protein
MTLGNELDGVQLFESKTVQNFKNRYPDGHYLSKNASSSTKTFQNTNQCNYHYAQNSNLAIIKTNNS